MKFYHGSYSARRGDVRRFGHLARKIRVTPPLKHLESSFAQIVRSKEMSMDPGRGMGKRRQEDWMEEDDLLGGTAEEGARSEEAAEDKYRAGSSWIQGKAC